MPELPSCIAGVTRKEYVTTVVAKASLVGGLMAAPMLVDAFMVPPAVASASMPGPLTDGQQPMGSTAW